MTKKKIALIVGHSADSPGAWGVLPIGKHEYFYNVDFAQTLSAALQDFFTVTIFFRDQKTIKTCYLGVAKWAPDASIELHFNAFTDPSVTGSGTLCSTKNQKFAEALQSAQTQSLGRSGKSDRGIEVIVNQQDRGWENVEILDPVGIPNCLIEPFFGSSPLDCQLALGAQEDLAIAIRDALVSFLGAAGSMP